ncbi:MAG: HPr family phosphocarrier protein [Lentisphaeria bacterium]|jgi:phosphocarrier protein
MENLPADSKLSTDVFVHNDHGLHLRCASDIANIAMQFNAVVKLSKGRHSVNAKSMLEILTLSAAPGARLTLSAKGNDAQQALDAISAIFQKFNSDQPKS